MSTLSDKNYVLNKVVDAYMASAKNQTTVGTGIVKKPLDVTLKREDVMALFSSCTTSDQVVARTRTLQSGHVFNLFDKTTSKNIGVSFSVDIARLQSVAVSAQTTVKKANIDQSYDKVTPVVVTVDKGDQKHPGSFGAPKLPTKEPADTPPVIVKNIDGPTTSISPALSVARNEARSITGSNKYQLANSPQKIRDALIADLSAQGGFTQADKDAVMKFDWNVNSKGANLVLTYPPVKVPDSGYIDNPNFNGGPATGATTPPSKAKPSTGTGTGSTPKPDVPPPAFTLIKGDKADDVYVLNDRKERFHVTAALGNEMHANGTWVEPTVKPQAEVDAMAKRFAVGTFADLSTINNTTVGNNWMLVKGGGTPNPSDEVLIGNSNAIYAIDDKGNKFHITYPAFQKMVADNGGQNPVYATVAQAAADEAPVNGALALSNGGIVTTADPIMDKALASVSLVMTELTPPVVVVGTPPVPAADDKLAVQMSSEKTSEFRLVQGDSTEVKSDTDLVGNGRAIYAVNNAGQKFHITAALWDKMNASGITKPIEKMSQAQVDGMPNGSTVSLTNLEQIRVLNITPNSEYRLIKGDAANLGNDVLKDNGAAIYALTSTGDRYHITAGLAEKMQQKGAFSAVETLKQQEVDSLGQMKGSLTTISQFNNAVKNQPIAGGGVNDSSNPASPPNLVGFSQPN